MGLFSRKSSNEPTNPEVAELGREYAIAKRHGDRKKVRQIDREIGKHGKTFDHDSFDHGKQSYDALPPVPGFKRTKRGNRR